MTDPPHNSHDPHAGHSSHRPCPYCGVMLRPNLERCPACRIRLDERTRRNVQAMSGPWFVYHPRHPGGPGVEWGKLCRMIETGQVRADSIVRGPTTGGLWRLAGETPGVATRLGICSAQLRPVIPRGHKAKANTRRAARVYINRCGSTRH